jgi:hypothetical protein
MKIDPRIEPARIRTGYYASKTGDPCGFFEISGPCGQRLTVLASNASDPIAKSWEHVSVSGRRIPNWKEMCFIKDLFWDQEECVVQFHPKRSEYVNNQANVLHMWRWLGGEFPRPPDLLVGLRDYGEIKDLEQAREMRKEINRRTK